ncbi:alpha/beta hydrolase [uncultured Psychroserpens sp.]|uniref:alpha/beta fold hydrolase n=1 Tax=uncultured Psychroserpens sp. TaxID=255436 RepID=UPI002629528F|nr:alpha/beta hydrolase [uncultured Psychroserpens sp.]
MLKYSKYLHAKYIQIVSLQSMVLRYKNVPVFYEDEGHGSPVILLHGFLENSTMWHAVKAELLQNHRVVSVDLLGHGQTGCLGYIHTMQDMADAVLAVVNDLKLSNYSLIGHSMGGYVALVIAQRFPERVLGLCLMNSTYHADDAQRKQIRKRANIMVQSNYEAVVRMSFVNLFSPESRSTFKIELEEALNEALQIPLQGYIAAQEGMMVRSDMYSFFKALDAKKLIIIGAKDPVIHRQRILKETIGSDIVCRELSNGHMSHIENKSELTYILKHFIE